MSSLFSPILILAAVLGVNLDNAADVQKKIQASGVRGGYLLAPANPAQRAASKAEADQICQGVVLFRNVHRKEPITVGMNKIDWRGGQRDHQEWVAQLNRFFMLDPLAVAWEDTKDEKYPARARELMTDYMNAIASEPATFVDYQWGGNLLNAACRLERWTDAVVRFRGSKAFDEEFQKRVLNEINRLGNEISRRTKPGLSNWQIAQSSALVTTALALPEVPGAAQWRKHGCEVLNACFRLQMRQDGTHRENTVSYHSWMFREMIGFRNLKVAGLLPELDISETMFRGGFDFMALAGDFSFNDMPVSRRFPKAFSTMPEVKSFLKIAGIKDYKVPMGKVFPDAGMVFCGNKQEKVFFDAAKFSGGHSHWNRLALEFNFDGFYIVTDPGTTTYDFRANQPGYLVGRQTSSHATVNFSVANQLCVDAKLVEADVKDSFATALGEFNGGYFQGTLQDFRKAKTPNIPAEFRRRMVWIAGEYLLIMDRTRCAKPGVEVRTVFPLAPAERADVKGLRYTAVNQKTPSVLLEMIVPASADTRLTVLEGEAKAALPGWKTVTPPAQRTSPVVSYIAPVQDQYAVSITLLAVRPAGAVLPEYKVLQSAPGKLTIGRPDGSRDEYTWAADLSGLEWKNVKK